MLNVDLIREYERDQHRRGHQPSSVLDRTRFLRRYGAWLGDTVLLASTTDDFQRYLDSRNLVAKSRYSYIDYLHGFFDWARRTGYADGDPTLAIIRPKLPRRLPRPISVADLEAALASAPVRERAILLLAAFAGLRAIEISRLTREDILDSETPPMLVAFGKGAKERWVPLHAEVLSALRMLPMPKTGPVFRLINGRQANSWNISHAGNTYLDRTGTDASLHQLRHWFGTHLYRTSGHDLLLVAALMGHESSATTSIYARYDRTGAGPAVQALSVDSGTSAQTVVRSVP